MNACATNEPLLPLLSQVNIPALELEVTLQIRIFVSLNLLS